MHRIFLALIILISCSFAVTKNSTVQFKDLDDKHWAAKSVYNCVRLGITKGYPDGTFRGEKQINRYELMVFLSNLTISLEKMMDDKLENAMFAGESETNNRALDELKAELAVLKEEMLADSAEGSTLNIGFGGRKKYGPEIHGSYDAYGGTHAVKTVNNFWENQYFQRLTLFVSGNLNDATGYLAGIDTDYILWGPGTNQKADDVLEGNFYTSKRLSNDVGLHFYLSKGPGQIKMANKKIASRHDDAVAIGMDTYGVNTTVKFAVLGTTNNYDIDGDGTKDTLQVSELSPAVFYTIPWKIPYMGNWTVGYVMTQVSTEKNRTANDILRTSRYAQINKFEITDKITWQTKHMKEIVYTPTKDINADAIHNESQGFYYDTSIAFGDIFNSGTTWELVYAYRGKNFGGQGLLEPPAGVNIFGYESCAYFFEDWENNNRMPSANIITEGGAKLTQNLYKDNLYLQLLYLSGTAIPDPDKELPSGDNDTTKYIYSLAGINIFWNLNDYFNFYLGCEQKKLHDSTIEDQKDQYVDTYTFLGMGCRF